MSNGLTIEQMKDQIAYNGVLIHNIGRAFKAYSDRVVMKHEARQVMEHNLSVHVSQSYWETTADQLKFEFENYRIQSLAFDGDLRPDKFVPLDEIFRK